MIAARIAAHAADIAKGVPGAMEQDLQMARHRKRLDWEGQFAVCLDPERARRMRAESGVADHGAWHHVRGVLRLQGHGRCHGAGGCEDVAFPGSRGALAAGTDAWPYAEGRLST